jgi:hypothetical protein
MSNIDQKLQTCHYTKFRNFASKSLITLDATALSGSELSNSGGLRHQVHGEEPGGQRQLVEGVKQRVL